VSIKVPLPILFTIPVISLFLGCPYQMNHLGIHLCTQQLQPAGNIQKIAIVAQATP
jgi:hypothetical protein